MQVAAREDASTPHALGARVAASRSTAWRAECTRVDLESGDLVTTHAFIAEWRGDSDDDDDDGDDDEQLQGRKGSTSWSESDRTNAASTRAAPVLPMLSTALHSTDELELEQYYPIDAGYREDASYASPVKKPTKVHTRTRRAQEIKRLHVEREELEKRLRMVRDMAKSWPLRSMGLNDLRYDLYASSSPTPVAMTVASSSQQRRAECEREMLLISQGKNERLRAELKMQKQAARSLYRLVLQRAAAMAALRKSLRLPLLSCALPRDALDDRAVFARLLAATSAMFKDVDNVAALLRSRIKLSEEGSFRAWDVNERALSGNGTAAATRFPRWQLQLVDCEELPFPRPQVHHAIRAFYKEIEIRDFAKEHFNIADNDDNTIMMKLVLSRDTKKAGLIHVRMRQVVRSFNTPEHSGFVSLLEIDLLTLDGQPLPTGPTITEQKWTILPRHNSTAADTLDRRYETTQNQTFAIISQEVPGAHCHAPPPLLTLAADHKGGGKLPADAEEWDTGYSSTNRRIQNHLMSFRAPPQVY